MPSCPSPIQRFCAVGLACCRHLSTVKKLWNILSKKGKKSQSDEQFAVWAVTRGWVLGKSKPLQKGAAVVFSQCGFLAMAWNRWVKASLSFCAIHIAWLLCILGTCTAVCGLMTSKVLKILPERWPVCGKEAALSSSNSVMLFIVMCPWNTTAQNSCCWTASQNPGSQDSQPFCLPTYSGWLWFSSVLWHFTLSILIKRESWNNAMWVSRIAPTNHKFQLGW